MDNNKLLEIFGVKNYAELDKFIEKNPNDQRVKELKEIMEMMENPSDDKKENK